MKLTVMFFLTFGLAGASALLISEPATMLFFGGGLLGAAGIGRKFFPRR